MIPWRNQLPVTWVLWEMRSLLGVAWRKESRLKRGAILIAVAASLMCYASPAAAKGNIPTRAYAVVTGPGLAHPIVFVAPWKESVGGFSAGEGDLFLALAGASGALPAGRVQTEGGAYIPSGVLPIDEVPSKAARGLRYRLTWFRDGVNAVAKQNIYPYAPNLPLVYTFPSSRRALIVLFGRFQAPAHLWTGWGRATSFDLKNTLLRHGLPTVTPPVASGQGDDPASSVPTDAPSATPTRESLAPGSQAGPVLAVGLAAIILSTAFLWIRRRRHSRSAPGLMVALVLVLVACSGSGRPSLDWGDYDPSVKQRIDAIVNEQSGVDCNDLQDEFADAKASAADDLMAWINWKADQVGCFPEGTGPFR